MNVKASIHAYDNHILCACQMAVTCTFQPAHGASTGALLNCQGPGGGVVTVGENINLNVAILLHL